MEKRPKKLVAAPSHHGPGLGSRKYSEKDIMGPRVGGVVTCVCVSYLWPSGAAGARARRRCVSVLQEDKQQQQQLAKHRAEKDTYTHKCVVNTKPVIKINNNTYKQ